MFSAVRALALGEDLHSDPVSTALGLGLAAFTRGHLAISGQLLSQARPAILHAQEAPRAAGGMGLYPCCDVVAGARQVKWEEQADARAASKGILACARST